MDNQIQGEVTGSAVFPPPPHPTRGGTACSDAGMAIDGIVVASCDQLDGRGIAIMMASGSVGGVSRDILSTPSSAEHAFVLAALRERSALCSTQLMVSMPMRACAALAVAPPK
jgi:acetyl-CoA C-acetyltransferase